jgi:chemotaxis protein histidine kinase CheA
VALAAHSLKSSFAMMGSHDLQAVMKQVEILAKESHNEVEIRRLFDIFTGSIEAMLEELEKYKSKLR